MAKEAKKNWEKAAIIDFVNGGLETTIYYVNQLVELGYLYRVSIPKEDPSQRGRNPVELRITTKTTEALQEWKVEPKMIARRQSEWTAQAVVRDATPSTEQPSQEAISQPNKSSNNEASTTSKPVVYMSIRDVDTSKKISKGKTIYREARKAFAKMTAEEKLDMLWGNPANVPDKIIPDILKEAYPNRKRKQVIEMRGMMEIFEFYVRNYPNEVEDLKELYPDMHRTRAASNSSIRLNEF